MDYERNNMVKADELIKSQKKEKRKKKKFFVKYIKQ